MPRRGTYPQDSTNPNAVTIAFSFRPNGATGVVAGSTKGRGVSVARTGIGAYTATLDQAYNHLLSAVGSVREATATAHTVTFGAYDAANKTVTLVVYDGTPAAADLAADANNVVNVTLTMQKSVLPAT